MLPRICSETGGRVRARVRRALVRVDADAVRVRAAKARLERSVRVFPSHVVGLESEWVVVLPAHESALCKAAVEDHAAALRREDPDLSADQARADALVDLVLARASVTTTVNLSMPVETLTVDAPADRPQLDEDGVVVGPSWQQVCAMGYEIPGVGVIPGDIVAGICSRFDTRIRRVLLDPASGTTVETGAAGYTPSAGGAPVRRPPGRDLPGAGLRAGGAVLRPGPRHPLAAGADRPHQPADVVPAASPDEAPDELVGGDGRRRDRAPGPTRSGSSSSPTRSTTTTPSPPEDLRPRRPTA